MRAPAPALPGPLVGLGARLRLTGNWEASARLEGAAARGRVVCSSYRDTSGTLNRLVVVSTDPSAVETEGLGVGEGHFALAFTYANPDGSPNAHAELNIQAGDHFQGYQSNARGIGGLEGPGAFVYRISADGRRLRLEARMVTGATSTYDRADDIGITGVSLAVRCP